MSRREDFEIVDDDETEGGRRRTPPWWLWLGGAALLIIFAGAFALITFSQRVTSPSLPTPVAGNLPGPTATSVGFAPAATWTPIPDSLASPTPDATPTETPTEMATGTPTPEPSPTPCPILVAGEFSGRYSYAELGCPLGQPQTVWAAWQPFQGGQMFWRRDTDQAFVLSNAGIYSPITERWDGSASPDRGAPPPGLYAPERGFGAVWARSDDLYNLLGWATQPERGFCARIQDYEYGAMVISDPVPNCTPENLYNHASAGDWQPLFFRFTEAGSWQ